MRFRTRLIMDTIQRSRPGCKHFFDYFPGNPGRALRLGGAPAGSVSASSAPGLISASFTAVKKVFPSTAGAAAVIYGKIAAHRVRGKVLRGIQGIQRAPGGIVVGIVNNAESASAFGTGPGCFLLKKFEHGGPPVLFMEGRGQVSVFLSFCPFSLICIVSQK